MKNLHFHGNVIQSFIQTYHYNSKTTNAYKLDHKSQLSALLGLYSHNYFS